MVNILERVISNAKCRVADDTLALLIENCCCWRSAAKFSALYALTGGNATAEKFLRYCFVDIKLVRITR